MKKLWIVLCSTMLMSAHSAHAINSNFLKDAPIAHFNNEDVDLLIKTAKAALNEAADGEQREWHNPKTGSAGTVKPIDTTEGVNGKCRTLAYSNNYKTLLASGQILLCKQADGNWKAPVARKKAK